MRFLAIILGVCIQTLRVSSLDALSQNPPASLTRTGSHAFCQFDGVSVLRGGRFALPSWPSFEGDRGEVFAGVRNKFSQLKASVDFIKEGEKAPKASRLSGKWTKVKEVNQDEAMLKLGLNVVFRKAAILLSRIQINATPTNMDIITKGPLIVSIKESYNFDGTWATHGRRDKRWGKSRGKIVTASESKVELDITWDDPHGGVLKETFEVDPSGDELTHTSVIKVNEDATDNNKPGEWYTYYSVYRRS
mmetsp:Transcript_27249/g.55638  ORF Transcript_27249/g.55638 Transcript_27249/m.55638 type:complete len:248 (+) Transcript_27249:33-776(+)